MREFKFRIFNKKENNMDYVEKNNLCLTLNGIPSGFWDRANILKSSNFVLMQWTGLKDRNKKDIYEGDVVNTGSANNSAIISMKFGCWNATLIGDDESVGIAIGHPETLKCLEVIGNIFENPELVESEKK